MGYSANQISELSNEGDRFLDVRDVATRFNISIRGVHRLVARGELTRPLKIGRCSRWRPADIASFEGMLVKRRNAENGGGFRE